MRHLLATATMVALLVTSGGAVGAQEASPDPGASPTPEQLAEPGTRDVPFPAYWGEWTEHKEAVSSRLSHAITYAEYARLPKKARFYRDVARVNKDELVWLANHQPRDCYREEYEAWRTATEDLKAVHAKAAQFAKAGKRAGLKRTHRQQQAALRSLDKAHRMFSDCPDLSLRPIRRSPVSPIVGSWTTRKDHVEADGRHFRLRIHVKIGRNGTLLGRDKQGIGCEGLGIGIVPVTMRGNGEFVTERKPRYRWNSARVHCYPKGRPPRLLTPHAAGEFIYDKSADILYETQPANCFWRKNGGSPKDCAAFWRGTPPRTSTADDSTEEGTAPEEEASAAADEGTG